MADPDQGSDSGSGSVPKRYRSSNEAAAPVDIHFDFDIIFKVSLLPVLCLFVGDPDPDQGSDSGSGSVPKHYRSGNEAAAPVHIHFDLVS